MNAEEQLRNLKQIPPLTKEEKRRKIMTAITLAFAAAISVLFLLYAFIQKQEAEKQKELSVQLKAEAEKQREIAEHQRLLAEKAMEEAMRLRVLAEEALRNCENRKR